MCSKYPTNRGELTEKRPSCKNSLQSCGADESIQHILFQCDFAKQVWNLTPWANLMDLDSYPSFKTALQQSVSMKNLSPMGTSSNLFPWICWNLWISRNHLIFQNRNTAPKEVITTWLTSFKEWEGAQSSISPLPLRTNPEIQPHQSSAQRILCHTDAAWRSDSCSAGLSWIFTDQSSSEIARGCQFQEHISSPLIAEALAIRSALEHAVSLNLNHIWIHSYFKVLVQVIIANRLSIKLFGVLADIEILIRTSFVNFHISFIPRNLNRLADAYAKTCLCTKLSLLGLASC